MTTLFRFAVICAGIALLVAPFRSSAGLRGGLLVLALLALIWLRQIGARHLLSAVLPTATLRPLLWVLVWWVTVVGVLSIVGPAPLESLRSWRGDVLTPIGAGLVFFALTRHAGVLAAWLLVLFVSLIILTIMVVADPFQPFVHDQEPHYVSVGWLSTWLVMLAALLPLGWLIAWPKPRMARAIGVVAVAAILIAAWFTASRMVWVCFAAMFVIYGGLHWRADRSSVWRIMVWVLAGLVTMAAFFYASALSRANLYPKAAPDASSFMLQDNRAVIWREALGLIAEKPIVGHGYALEAPRQALSQRFTDPWFRDVFKHAHNIVLNYAIQLGIIGVLALLVLFAVLARTFWVARTASDFSRSIAACGLMLVAGFFLRNMMDDFFSRHAALLLGALIGMLLAVGSWPVDGDKVTNQDDAEST